MSIESKYAYRFEYLKSEKWQSVRLEALVREKGKCQICAEESLSNDAHHVWYPESVWETTAEHLVILCRPCHDFLHAMLPNCKTNDEEIGREYWTKFRNAIEVWRSKKQTVFENGIQEPSTNKDLRIAYRDLKRNHLKLRASMFSPDAPIDQQLALVLDLIKSWAKQAKKKAIDKISKKE